MAGTSPYGRPELISISVSAGHEAPSFHHFRFIILELNRWKESGWDITAGSAVANGRTSSFPAKATEFMCVSVNYNRKSSWKLDSVAG
jgi:hypothetical protein